MREGVWSSLVVGSATLAALAKLRKRAKGAVGRDRRETKGGRGISKVSTRGGAEANAVRISLRYITTPKVIKPARTVRTVPVLLAPLIRAREPRCWYPFYSLAAGRALTALRLARRRQSRAGRLAAHVPARRLLQWVLPASARATPEAAPRPRLEARLDDQKAVESVHVGP
jgi:hypothetical protein